jgi:hypothetical protein
MFNAGGDTAAGIFGTGPFLVDRFLARCYLFNSVSLEISRPFALCTLQSVVEDPPPVESFVSPRFFGVSIRDVRLRGHTLHHGGFLSSISTQPNQPSNTSTWQRRGPRRERRSATQGRRSLHPPAGWLGFYSVQEAAPELVLCPRRTRRRAIQSDRWTCSQSRPRIRASCTP